jgi:hypothetical protein
MIQQGMSRRQAEEALEVDVRDLRLDIRRSLAQESKVTAFSGEKNDGKARARASREPGSVRMGE